MHRLQKVIVPLYLAVICYLAYRQLSSLNASYGPFLADDSLISYRYAERLVAGQGLTWNNGERVEGYSNLAWVLLLAAYRWLGGDLLVGGRVLGLACGLLTFVAIALALRPRTLREVLAPLAGLFALATASPFVVWTTAGLEQPLLAACLAVAVALAREDLDATTVPCFRRHGLGAALFLLCWTRPDGALLAGAILIAWALLRRKAEDRLRAPLLLAVWPAAAMVSQLVFRIAYYHAMVPNTALAKLGFTSVRIGQGFVYAKLATLALWPLLAFVLVALVFAFVPAKGPRKFGLFALPFALWLVYVVCIGGDIFPAHRHFVPLLVLAAFAFAETVRLLASFSWRGTVVGLSLLALVPTLLSQYAKTDPQARRALDERWEWDGQLVGNFLRKAFHQQSPLLAVDPAGCIPFFSGLPSIDMLGLNDRFLASHPPASFGTGRIGHELGNGAYVLDRKPDLALFCMPTGNATPCFPSGREMVRDPRWAEEYRPVVFETRTPRVVRSLTYVRTVGAKLGAREDNNGRVAIPPYLFTGTKGVAVFDKEDLVAELPPGTSVDLPITLPHAGRYKIDVWANPPGSLLVGVRSNGAIDPSGEFTSAIPRATLALSVSRRSVLRGVVLTPIR
jgi:hypothetical protein